jgi:hypothetical protein
MTMFEDGFKDEVADDSRAREIKVCALTEMVAEELR